MINNIDDSISAIIEKVGKIIDTNGLSRTLIIMEIIQMLSSLNETIQKREDEYTKEKEDLLIKLKTAESIIGSEINQNGRGTE